MPAWIRRSLISLATLVAVIVVVVGTDIALARGAERRAAERFESEVGPLDAAAILDLPSPEANAAIPLRRAVELLRLEPGEEQVLHRWRRAFSNEGSEDDAAIETGRTRVAELNGPGFSNVDGAVGPNVEDHVDPGHREARRRGASHGAEERCQGKHKRVSPPCGGCEPEATQRHRRPRSLCDRSSFIRFMTSSS